MKKKIFTISTFSVGLMLFFSMKASAQTVEDANVSLSNLSSNSYWDNYDDNTKMVTGLNFLVLADGTNSSYVTPAFSIKVYIWDGSNPTFVKTYNDAGIWHFGSKDYSNESIDLSSLPLPAGTYQLGIYVDADDDIPNPPDDPADNAYLLNGDINFTPASSAVTENEKIAVNVYPNPTVDFVNITWEKDQDNGIYEISLMNMQGQIVKNIAVDPAESTVKIDMQDLVKGTYILAIRSETGVITKKILRQ